MEEEKKQIDLTGTLTKEVIRFSIKGKDGKENFYYMDREAQEKHEKFMKEKEQEFREKYLGF